MCMMLVMLPFFMLAMYEKHGQPLEKIVGNILKVAVIRPKQRPYQTNNFYAVAARTLDGKERLSQLHAVFHMDEQLPFQFEWDWLAPSGLSTKDFIAPSSFEFRTGKQFRMGKKYGAVSFLQILAPELNDRLLADFLDMESSLIVSMHIQSVDQVKAIKTVKRKITDLDRSKIEEQKKAVRAGYDMDIIPSDLATYGSEAKKLLQDLQSRNERMFLLTFLVLNTADNPRQLGNNIFQAGSIAQKYNCQLTRLDFQQEEGLMSCLPLGLNQIEIQRGLTTSSTAIFVPFTTQELFQNGKEALYYGINALSNNLIMVDRKLLKNPNGLILGTPGSGKSFSAKREIANCFLLTSDDVIICDPEAEYAPLVERLHGQVIKISPTSANYINPMDLNLDYSDDESPLSLKSDFILSLCELIVGGKVSCHYCDSVGFTQIPGFLPENPLKNAEMMLEDDYGMIDGIINNGAKEPTVAELEQQARSGQPISLMELAAATHREEREKKKSVMEQLKGQPKTEHKKTALKKSAEREI